MRVRNKKNSGPKHDDADASTSPPSCWSAGFRKRGPSQQRPNGKSQNQERRVGFFRKMALEKCFGGVFFKQRWLLEKIKHTHAHNNNFKSRFLFLQETDGSNFKAKLLVWSTNVHRSDINDGQARCFRCLVVDDCLAPCTGVWLEEGKNKGELESTFKNGKTSHGC